MLAKRVKQLESKAPRDIRGVIPWDLILPMILNLISAICKKPVPPAPEPPTPLTSEAQKAAWEDAHVLQWHATNEWKGGEVFQGPSFNRVARETKQKERRDNKNKISMEQAKASTTIVFSNARTSKLEDLYNDVIEARHAQ